MSIKKLTIEGFRGYSKETEINFAIPDGNNYGSGLTVLVGPNNSGKSTIIEAIHLLSINSSIIPNSSRNSLNQGKVKIEAVDNIGNVYSLQSTSNEGAFVERKYNNITQEYWDNRLNTFILTNKRNFLSTFSNNSYQTRENYKSNIGDSEYRTENNINGNFGGRLLTIYRKNRKIFDECLEKILNPVPKWTIESSGNNILYLEFSFNNVKHSSNGAGDGYINIFNIVDALYDSSENNVILIDEPEVSLHPDLQQKLFKLLVEYSKDKQIIISTHSPYFVDWSLFSKKSKIIRFRKEIDGINTYELKESTKNDIDKLIRDTHHPHILSLDSNTIFFLNDNVILTEGQDDVICYKEIFKKYKYINNASFFGWGAGGADKIEYILNILVDLGYKKVFIILDNNKKNKAIELSKKYPKYKSYVIETNDVRNKDRDKKAIKLINEINSMEIEASYKSKIISLIEEKFPAVEGLIVNMKDFEINLKYEDDILNLINNLKDYFSEEKFESDNNEIYELEDFENQNNVEVTDLNEAHKLLDSYINKNKLYEYICNKYKFLEFKGGTGGLLSFKKINKNLYYAIYEVNECVSEKHGITIDFHLIINTKKEKVKLKSQKVVSDTLPKK